MTPVVTSDQGVTLIGGGRVDPHLLTAALALAPVLVAADGGADAALALGQMPRAVIGDLDSLSEASRARLTGRLHRVAEQDTTDFEKCLLRIAAPYTVAVGFSGPRMDHTLTAMNVLARRIGPPTVLLTEADAVLVCPAHLRAGLPVGTRLSLFPMGAATAEGEGLQWPPNGIDFTPDGRIGTSNRTTGPLDLRVRGPMLLILPIEHLTTAISVARQ